MKYEESKIKTTYSKIVSFLNDLETERQYRYLTKKEEELEKEIFSFFEEMDCTLHE